MSTGTITEWAMEPVHPLLGVEVRGARLDAHPDERTVRALWTALDAHSLLVFRDNPLEDADLMALAAHLGEADGGVRRYSTQGPAAADARPSRWHSHGGFGQGRPAVLCISALRECPEGGEIEFAAARAAHDALDGPRREFLAGLTAIHRFGNIVHGAAGSAQPVRHPLIHVDPVTGRRSLFVGYHAVAIEGMDDGEAAGLLAELHAFATEQRLVHRHQWRPNDLLLWDLCALLHHTLPVRGETCRTLHEIILATRRPATPAVTGPASHRGIDS